MFATRVIRSRRLPGSEHLRHSWWPSVLAAALVVVSFVPGPASGQSAEALNEQALLSIASY
jgi:hypothetical protein